MTHISLFAAMNSFENDFNNEFTIYKHTENGIYAECIKGMWSAVQIGLLKIILNFL